MELRLHADDLKQLEDMFARALARGLSSAIRLLVKEGTLSGIVRAAETAEVAPEAATMPPVEVVPPPAEPVPTPVEAAPPVEPPPPPPATRTRTPIGKILKTVADRPDGYVTTERATATLNLGPNGKTILQAWARASEIKAVIVANFKPPTKGAPGRVMVDMDSVRERDRIRRDNARRLNLGQKVEVRPNGGWSADH